MERGKKKKKYCHCGFHIKKFEWGKEKKEFFTSHGFLEKLGNQH